VPHTALAPIPTPMPNCVVVQHVAPEPAFAVGDAVLAAGITIDTCRVFDGDDIPRDVSGLDGLVVMGGPMSATSDEGFPTRKAEINLLAEALAAGIPTLGICLGAQLLAVAGGGSVYRDAQGPEIGWAPVHLAPACQDDPLFVELPSTLTVLHWHSETLDMPSGSQRLSSTMAYPNQAYRIGDMAWGVQFHLEVTAEAVDGFLDAFPEDVARVPGGPEAVRAATPAAVAALASARDLVCGRFARLVAAQQRMSSTLPKISAR
jgi:GMP synthase-like glutamine amidotransferase